MTAPVPIEVRHAIVDDMTFVWRDAKIPAVRLERMIADSQVFLATLKGEPVGFARLEYLWAKFPFLASIFVSEQHRGRGVGGALLAAIEREQREAEQPFLYSSSQADESAAQAWHRRSGFAECGFIAGINRDGIGEVFFRKPIR